MTAMVLTSAYVAVAGVSVSNRCKKIEITVEVDEKDVTTFASAGWKEVLGGIKSGGLAMSFNNDNTDDDLDEDFWGYFGTLQTFEVRPTSAAVGVTNPKFTGSVLVKELKPIAGGVGDVNEFDVTWPTSGAVTRATA